jgi:hypothetical protein
LEWLACRASGLKNCNGVLPRSGDHAIRRAPFWQLQRQKGTNADGWEAAEFAVACSGRDGVAVFRIDNEVLRNSSS